jgi:hypothetical protein
MKNFHFIMAAILVLGWAISFPGYIDGNENRELEKSPK